MTDDQIQKLLDLIILGQQAFMEAMNIINNHKKQEGMTDTDILADAERRTKNALELINSL